MTRALRFIPAVLLMVTIFLLSSRQNLSTGLGTWDTILRKGAHMAEFGVLWFLWWWAFRYRYAGVAAAITILYAISDEVHQHFVPTRYGSPVDVLIDTAGVVIAMIVAFRWRDRRARRAAAAAAPLDA